MFNAGDTVYVLFGRNVRAKAEVTRVTKTQTILEYPNYVKRYDRTTGRLIGGGRWETERIALPTPDLDEAWHEAHIDKARQALAEMARSGTDEQLRAAYRTWERLVDGD